MTGARRPWLHSIVLVAIVLAINPDETRQKLGEAEINISPGPQPEAFPTEPRT